MKKPSTMTRRRNRQLTIGLDVGDRSSFLLFSTKRVPHLHFPPFVETPPDNTVLWRYMDLPKLLSMLEKKSALLRASLGDRGQVGGCDSERSDDNNIDIVCGCKWQRTR
jgi:hypothetical protein